MERLQDELIQLLTTTPSKSETKDIFISRAREGNLTRDENKESHFCVYFAANDLQAKQVFMGHHKKSDLWLFNGGHIDIGETPAQTFDREISEEWGLERNNFTISSPFLLTQAFIDNLPKQLCRIHFDIWYSVPIIINSFHPDEGMLQEEFHESKWMTIEEAKKKNTDLGTLEALDALEKTFIKS